LQLHSEEGGGIAFDVSQYTVSVAIVDQLFVCLSVRPSFFLPGIIHLIQLVCGSSFFLSFFLARDMWGRIQLFCQDFPFVLFCLPATSSRIFLFCLSQSLFLSVVVVSGLGEKATHMHPGGLVPVT
jgi:hypothetical protein